MMVMFVALVDPFGVQLVIRVTDGNLAKGIQELCSSGSRRRWEWNVPGFESTVIHDRDETGRERRIEIHMDEHLNWMIVKSSR